MKKTELEKKSGIFSLISYDFDKVLFSQILIRYW